jgi:hypothetical protein
MAIPIAVAAAEESPGVWKSVAEFAYVGAPFSVNIKDNGSFDPDAGTIVAWQWTLIDAPPSSTASLLNPTTATPTLQNVDKEGSYRIFLEVTDDNLPPEDSEPDKNLAPDSAFCTVIMKTQNHDWKIPAEGGRRWADDVYAMWMDIDDLLPVSSVWDVTHQLIFTSGNTAQIRDNRVATAKDGLYGLIIDSTTGVNVNVALYEGLHIEPGANAGDPVNHPTWGIGITDIDKGIYVNNPAQKVAYDFVYGSGVASPTGLLSRRSGIPTTVVNCVRHEEQSVFQSVRGYATDKNSPQAFGLWGSWAAYSGLKEALFGIQTLAVTTLICDFRSNPTGITGAIQGNAEGVIEGWVDIDATAGASAQDVVVLRVVRHAGIANQVGKDFGLMWRESAAVLASVPPDPDIYPEQTFVMKRPDGSEWGLHGVQRARVGKDPVPFERPGWIQGRKSSTNPSGGGSNTWTFDVALPSTVTIDTSEGGGECNARLERPITEWSLDEEDFVVSAALVTAPANAVRVTLKYAEQFETTSGQGTFTKTTPVNGQAETRTFNLPTPMKVGTAWATTLSIQLIPYMDGTLVTDIPIMAVDQVTVNGSNQLTAFSYIVQPKDDDHGVPTSMKFFYQIQVEKLFEVADVITELHWSALVTVKE